MEFSLLNILRCSWGFSILGCYHFLDLPLSHNLIIWNWCLARPRNVFLSPEYAWLQIQWNESLFHRIMKRTLFNGFQPIVEADVLKCHRELFARFPEQSWQANSLETLDMNLNISLNIFPLNKGKIRVLSIKNYEK